MDKTHREVRVLSISFFPIKRNVRNIKRTEESLVSKRHKKKGWNLYKTSHFNPKTDKGKQWLI